MNPLAQEVCTEMSDSGDTKSQGQGQTQRTRVLCNEVWAAQMMPEVLWGSQALSAEVRSLAHQPGLGWGCGGR